MSPAHLAVTRKRNFVRDCHVAAGSPRCHAPLHRPQTGMGLKGHSAPGTLFLCTNKASVAAAHVRSWRMQRWTPTTRCGRGTSVQWLEASRSRDRPTSPRHTSAAAAAEVDPLKIATAPTDFRFPYTNQIRHCYARHLEYHQCRKAGGDEALECDKFQRYYRSLCPTEWVVAWNEQRKFPGPL